MLGKTSLLFFLPCIFFLSFLLSAEAFPPSPALPPTDEKAGESQSFSPPSGSGGFLMDLAPVMGGTKGSIRAIAPNCDAIVGYIHNKPFAWSRRRGLRMLEMPNGETDRHYWGTALLVNDDASAAIGVIHAEGEEGIGLIWREGQPVKNINVNHIDFKGFSKDGKRIAGYLPNGEKSWYIDGEEAAKFLSGKGDVAAMSRDGRCFLMKDSPDAFVRNADGSREWKLTFGGIAPTDRGPSQSGGAVALLPLLRAGDPGNPLRDWGMIGKVSEELRHIEPQSSPMFLNYTVKALYVGKINYDGRFVLGEVTLYDYGRKNMIKEIDNAWFMENSNMEPSTILSVLVRFDAQGQEVVIADNGIGAIEPVAISDDGKTVLFKRGRSPKIWQEGWNRAQDLSEYLARYGLELPVREADYLVMSPDARCFFGELIGKKGEKDFPYKMFLACTGDVQQPHWNGAAAALERRAVE